MKMKKGIASHSLSVSHGSWNFYQMPLLFPWARNFTLIALYWLVPGTDFTIKLKEIEYGRLT